MNVMSVWGNKLEELHALLVEKAESSASLPLKVAFHDAANCLMNEFVEIANPAINTKKLRYRQERIKNYLFKLSWMIAENRPVLINSESINKTRVNVIHRNLY